MYIQGYRGATRRGAERGSLTACVYRQLYLARAIASPSATDRPNERAAAARQHQQPTRNITRPRSHGVYPPGPMLHELSRTIRTRRSPSPFRGAPRWTLRPPPRSTDDDASRGACIAASSLLQQLFSGIKKLGFYILHAHTYMKSLNFIHMYIGCSKVKCQN